MTAIVLRKHHEITAAFASTDASRYVLQGAHYNKEKGCLEASDGKMAIRVPRTWPPAPASPWIASFPLACCKKP
jgi:hypothetical protein